MLGLRTQETSKFEAFFSIVQEAAKKEGKVFFLEAGDGREIITETLEGEDLQGWLVPESIADDFAKEWEKDNIDDDWIDHFVFAVWKEQNNTIEIKFEAS